MICVSLYVTGEYTYTYVCTYMACSALHRLYKVIFECPERKGLKVFWLIIIIITSYSLKKIKTTGKMDGAKLQ